MGAHFKSNNKTLMGEIASFLNKKLSGIGAPSQPAALENAQEEGEEDEEDEGAPGLQTDSDNGETEPEDDDREEDKDAIIARLARELEEERKGKGPAGQPKRRSAPAPGRGRVPASLAAAPDASGERPCFEKRTPIASLAES